LNSLGRETFLDVPLEPVEHALVWVGHGGPCGVKSVGVFAERWVKFIPVSLSLSRGASSFLEL
jgi:hypothetical protein